MCLFMEVTSGPAGFIEGATRGPGVNARTIMVPGLPLARPDTAPAPIRIQAESCDRL